MPKTTGASTPLFGDLAEDRGRERLFTIGVAIGILLGMTVESTSARIVIGLAAIATIVVRTLAQIRHPDRDVPR